MPSPLENFGIDPNKKGRGSGLYYLRGNGMYSKYHIHRDSMIKANGWQKSPIGLPKKSSIRHAGDGIVRRYH
jgi:hypothetical protein